MRIENGADVPSPPADSHSASAAAIFIGCTWYMILPWKSPVPITRTPATIMTPEALRLRHEPTADCARYDSLRRTSG